MLVFIHADFPLDLTYLNVTFTKQNQWFKDDFSTEMSIPFDIYLDSELSKKTGFQSFYNANQNKTIFSGYLDNDGELTAAILKFQSIKGNVISAIINSGLDNFPSFDKKLSELSLEIKPVDDIITEAVSVITKVYPETNYNFQMVHTDKYDPTSEDYNDFGKIINKYSGGAFVTNSITVDNIDLVKNIMQPFPYLMHVIKKGIEDGGFTLAGDILTDFDLNRALIFRDGEYFSMTKKEELPATYKNNEYDNLSFIDNGYQYVHFSKEITVPKKGDYILFGQIESILYSWHPLGSGNRKRRSNINIHIYKVHLGVATEIWHQDVWSEGSGTRQYGKTLITDAIDVDVSFEAGDLLRIVKTEPRRDSTPSETPDNPEAISLKLIPSRYRNPDNSPILNLLNLNEINLTKVVPDMTFRELIMIIKNLKNYEFIPDGNTIYMNKIQGKLQRTSAKNISEWDIDEPERQFHEDREFVLAFTDGKTNEVYKYDSLLISSSGVLLNNYVEKTTTSPIKIDCLPLPVISRNGVTTSFNFEDQPSKLRLIFMKTMNEVGAPVGFWNEEMTIPKLYESDYKDWIDFRINSIAWNWEFVISVEKFREITVQTLVYAYKNYHIFSEVEKERLNSMYWRITAKTESLL